METFAVSMIKPYARAEETVKHSELTVLCADLRSEDCYRAVCINVRHPVSSMLKHLAHLDQFLETERATLVCHPLTFSPRLAFYAHISCAHRSLQQLL